VLIILQHMEVVFYTSPKETSRRASKQFRPRQCFTNADYDDENMGLFTNFLLFLRLLATFCEKLCNFSACCASVSIERSVEDYSGEIHR